MRPSLNLPQHIDVEHDRGKRFCCEAFSNLSQHVGENFYALRPSLSLSQHIDFEQGRGKRLCVVAFSNLGQYIEVE